MSETVLNLFDNAQEPVPVRHRVTDAVGSGLRDNHDRGRVVDFLRDKIAADSEVSIVSAYFTIYAYSALASELDSIAELRFLFGEPKFVSALDPEKSDKKAFHIEDQQISLSNRLQQKQIARQCSAWIQNKVAIRSVKKSRLLHGKLYHIRDGRVDSALLGSSNFTVSGIGSSEKPNLELNLIVDSDRDRRDLKNWFEELWNDLSLVEDVKGEVLRYLEQIYVDHTPEFIYFKTLYHLFEKFLTDQAEDAKRFKQIEIIETEIWKTLFDFQRDGVKGAINKINAHNGCILADSVGLGKTYTALGVIKYFELRNHRVLVLCPKKLRDNWTLYLAHNNTDLNPFLKDRFAYTVLSHTDLSRESGRSGDINLESLNWGNYDLIVIDESHNFRNNVKGKRDEDGNIIRKSRYERLMEDVIQAGVKTKVLLLSATPVNNDLKDLRNQIYFITEGNDTAFSESFSVPSIKETLTTAQRTFMDWAKGQGGKDAKALLERLPAGFFMLLDELTIARSRKHIKRYYSATMSRIGDFPVRNRPHAVFSDIDTDGAFLSYDALNDQIDNYQLSLFKPSAYVLEEFKGEYMRQAGNFTQADRERFLIGMMKVNFLKRLESSVRSFAITMERTVQKIESLEARLKVFQQYTFQAEQPGGSVEGLEPAFTQDMLDESAGEDEDLAQAFEVGRALKYKMAHLDVSRWLQDLEKDRRQLQHLRDQALIVTAERDAKFAELKKRIREKIEKPTLNKHGEPIHKVIVFTAFADTASYLYDHLLEWARTELKVHIALVSGGARANRTTFGKAEFGDILINFSPRAKNRAKMKSMPQQDEISLLIATDCISEGQNLQDCDLLINYDIHWNPVRIIQRFGRIDRIGSLNPAIQLVNFWPTPDLNKYINLKNRVEARMALVDISATAEDNLLAATEIEDLIRDDLKYRDRQLLRLKDEVLDLEDFNESVALTEFTLDDFRMELANYIDANRKTLEEAPLGLYTLVPLAEDHLWLRPGVIFCLRQIGDTEGTETVNPLQPYYLIYIHATGDVRFGFAQPKQILELMRDLCSGRTEAHSRLCELFDVETGNGARMEDYSKLLSRAVQAILDQFGKRSFSSLLAGRGAKLTGTGKRAKRADDFELITWLVIRQDSRA